MKEVNYPRQLHNSPGSSEAVGTGVVLLAFMMQSISVRLEE